VNDNKYKKLVLFGAGKIGRSFIGQLFGRNGYEVVFIDMFKPIIDELNTRGNYNVIIKSNKKDEVINIKNVRGILVTDENRAVEEIANADLLAVSVGQQGLKSIFPLMAKGLIKRFDDFPKKPIDIIIAENLRNAAEYFLAGLKDYLPSEYPINELIGLVETSIGKMVPIMLKKDVEDDILQVFAESYNSLILDKRGFKNPIPEIEYLAPKENMKAWVDRKLFIHNLGHASAAYFGYIYNPKFVFLHEVLAVPEIFNRVRNTMLQAARILLKQYPDEFTFDSLTIHIDDLLARFTNISLGDTIFRVGCNLFRKLGREDRLAGVIHQALYYELPYDNILQAYVYGCHFRAKDEQNNLFKNDKEFIVVAENGIEKVLEKVGGFSTKKNSALFKRASEIEVIVRDFEHNKKTLFLKDL